MATFKNLLSFVHGFGHCYCTSCLKWINALIKETIYFSLLPLVYSFMFIFYNQFIFYVLFNKSNMFICFWNNLFNSFNISLFLCASEVLQLILYWANWETWGLIYTIVHRIQVKWLCFRWSVWKVWGHCTADYRGSERPVWPSNAL